MQTNPFPYQAPRSNHKGIAYTKYPNEKRPVVFVAHAYMGQDDFARGKAQWLAELGYVGIALDIYGDGKVAKDGQEAGALMLPFFQDRQELQNRILAAYHSLKNLPFADISKVGIIGFCFGGLASIELLRSGANLKGVCTFHSVVADSKFGVTAKRAPPKPMHGAFLLLHGSDDPLNTWQDLEKLAKELNSANVDWEFDLYGHTVHAFTNPQANDKNSGLVYDEKIAKRAFTKMELFFKEVFK